MPHTTYFVAAAAVVCLSVLGKILAGLSLLTWILLAPVWVCVLLLAWVIVNIGLRFAWDTISVRNKSFQAHTTARQKRPTLVATSTQRPSIPSRPSLQQVLFLFQQSFILPWYHKISPSPTFPTALDDVIHRSLDSISQRIENVDIPNALVSKVIPHLTRHIQEYRKVEHLVAPLTALGADEIDPMTLLRKHFPPGFLHPALPSVTLSDTGPSLEAHFRKKIKAVLQATLPAEERNSDITIRIATEILTCTVLIPLVNLLSDPDFWNRIIEDQAEKYLQERKQVNQLRAALDTVSGRNAATNPPSITDSPTRRTSRTKTLTISADTDSKYFERFVKSLSKIKSLTEAKRSGNDIDREIRSVRLEMESFGKSRQQGNSVEQRRGKLQMHLDRLHLARNQVDIVIKRLTGMSPHHKATRSDTRGVQITLKDILGSPSSLGYWMEFADRRGASRLVQFWMTVEAFKNPLESEEDTSDDSDGDTLSPDLSWDETRLSVLDEDLKMLWQTFLDPKLGSNAVDVNPKFSQSIEEAISHSNLPRVERKKQLLTARRHAFQAQNEVYYRMMDDLFEDFEETELFQKALADVEGMSTRIVNPTYKLSPPVPAPPRSKAGFPFSMTPLSHNRSMSSIFQRQPRWMSFSGSTTVDQTPGIGSEPAIPPDQTEKMSHLALKQSSSAPGLYQTRSWSTTNSSYSLESPLAPKGNKALDTLIGDSASGHRRALFGVEEDSPLDPSPSQETQRIEAIQAALTTIMARDDDSRSLPTSVELHPSSQSPGRRNHPERDDPLGASASSIRSLSNGVGKPFRRRPKEQVPTSRKASDDHSTISRRVFEEDEDYQDDQEAMQDDADAGSDHSDTFEVPLAPGDLDLTVEIARLQDKIAKLEDQDSILEKMIHMADLSGKTNEVQLLLRSQRDLRRELRAHKFRKLQHEQRDFDNRIVPGRTRVSIPNATIVVEEGGKQVVRYVIEIQQTSGDDRVDESWVVARRFQEFYDMHQNLKADDAIHKILKSKDIEPPSKRLVPVLTDVFVETRRSSLEVYLKALVAHQLICDHSAFRNFLSTNSTQLASSPRLKRRRLSNLKKKFKATTSSTIQEHAPGPGQGSADGDMVQTLYRQVAGSLDDIFLRPSMLEIATERLNKQAAGLVGAWDASLVSIGNRGLEIGGNYLAAGLLGQPDTQAAMATAPSTAAVSRISTTTETKRDLTGDFPEAMIDSSHSVDLAQTSMDTIAEETGASTFVGPICDFLVELFGLKDTNWLKKQAIVLIMQQFLGSTIERKIRDTVRMSTSTSAIDGYLLSFQRMMWPDGKNRRAPSVPRTDSEKLESRHEAKRKLHLLVPDLAANMIGKSQARRCAKQIFGVLQVKLLNEHMVLSILDEVIIAIFPEISPTSAANGTQPSLHTRSAASLALAQSQQRSSSLAENQSLPVRSLTANGKLKP